MQKVLDHMPGLESEDISEAVLYVLGTPPRVQVISADLKLLIFMSILIGCVYLLLFTDSRIDYQARRRNHIIQQIQNYEFIKKMSVLIHNIVTYVIFFIMFVFVSDC